MIALTGAIPALVVMWLFDRMDANRPEPRWRLRKVAIAGAFSTIPVVVVQLAMGFESDGTFASAATDGFLVAGLTEEVAKLLCVLLFVYRRAEFDERMDGITYAVRAGLGFALIENILYIHAVAGTDQFYFVWVGRALLAVPGHAIWAGFMGYYLARRRFDSRGPGVLGGLAIAVFLHGLYDFAIFAAPSFHHELGNAGILVVLGVPIAIIVFGGIALRRLARKAIAADDLAEHRAASSARAEIQPKK